MNGKSYWIWHYGDYEIYHNLQVHLRREESGKYRPPGWKLSAPYVNVYFRKDVESDGGYFICYMNGSGYLTVDGVPCEENKRIELTSGHHVIEVTIMKCNGLPSIYVESDVCPSDSSWLCNHCAGSLTPAGYNVKLDSCDKCPEIFPFEYERIEVTAKEKIGDGILYDFGNEYFGYLNISKADADMKFTVSYGESKEEALDTEYAVVTETVSGNTEYRLKQRAFRYIYVTPVNENLVLSADYEYIPLEQKCTFECDNDLFNDVYGVAKHTFHLNCREGFFDGIKRDRWIWAGDVYQSDRVNSYLFADKEIEQRSLIGLVGKEPVERHLNTIIDYSMLWIIALYEHYYIYGDKEFLKRIYPMAVKLTEFCETRINSDGFFEGDITDWTFIDWAEMVKSGPISALQILMIKVYSVMSEISKLLSEDDIFFEKYENLKSKVNEYYWSNDKGAYIESYKSETPSVTRHANVFAVMYDIADEKQTKSILDNVLKNNDIPEITTPYFRGYELDVLAKLGELSKVEDVIETYWGGMIKLGATTIWEEYDPEKNGAEHYEMYDNKYGKSLCHAWGAGPIYLWGRYYLGVYPTSAGFETFNIEPATGNIKKFKGAISVNGGMASVEYNDGEVTVNVTKPGGTLIWKGKKYTLEVDKTITVK